jgi:S-adenosylmethionine/arginine decarboxylase-like enzyme
MYHFMLDAFHGYRSRLDDLLLVHELLEELPAKMGLKAVMPPFILPYYNGVVPEDCGISAFVFLAGGHFTLHTFSFREVYFVDLVYPEPFDREKLEGILRGAFPAERVNSYYVDRDQKAGFPVDIPIDEKTDFGPHLFLNFTNYGGPRTMDDLFELFDTLPARIGMTPIIRPYAIKNRIGGEPALSIMTMIAESHISLHYFPKTGRAYLDLFSCRFFDYGEVGARLKQEFASEVAQEILISRGSKYLNHRSEPELQAAKAKSWLENIL